MTPPSYFPSSQAAAGQPNPSLEKLGKVARAGEDTFGTYKIPMLKIAVSLSIGDTLGTLVLLKNLEKVAKIRYSYWKLQYL